MGVDGQQATHYLNNQVTMTNQIENRRQSISGVSINEEMANLVRYQHAYNAAAKMIQTHAELLEVLVNRGNIDIKSLRMGEIMRITNNMLLIICCLT